MGAKKTAGPEYYNLPGNIFDPLHFKPSSGPAISKHPLQSAISRYW